MVERQPTTATLIARLRETLETLIAATQAEGLTGNARRALDSQIRDIVSKLGKFLNEIDPIRQPAAVFDPSNPKIVGRFIALALVAQARQPLAAIERFYGSGVYAIYYKGAFSAYKVLAKTETPIYVGKAAPALNNARTSIDQGDRLARRLEDHKKNIGKAVTTLKVSDFEYRALVVQSGWENAAEDYLIHLFQPIWNSETKILYGLGKHGDAAATRSNKRSPWDTLHSGRTWAGDKKLTDARSKGQILRDVHTHFEKTHVYKTIEEVLREFIQELRQV